MNTKQKEPIVHESTAEYAQGFLAARRGVSHDRNPYPSFNDSDRRTSWYVGWYDAKYSRKGDRNP